MEVLFEIFTDYSLLEQKNANINKLLGYPNFVTDTYEYRKSRKKYNANVWAAIVGEELVNACKNMTPAERSNYYDEENLKDFEYLIDNGWFPQPFNL